MSGRWLSGGTERHFLEQKDGNGGPDDHAQYNEGASQPVSRKCGSLIVSSRIRSMIRNISATTNIPTIITQIVICSFITFSFFQNGCKSRSLQRDVKAFAYGCFDSGYRCDDVVCYFMPPPPKALYNSILLV